LEASLGKKFTRPPISTEKSGHAVVPATVVDINRRIMVQASTGKKQNSISKITRAGGHQRIIGTHKPSYLGS
jgi:hypothetical protein